MVQVALVHERAETLGTMPQTVPQLPQSLGVVIEVSHPSPADMLQSRYPGAQLPRPQEKSTQLAVAFGGGTHALQVAQALVVPSGVSHPSR